jgi:hypothetical protein
VTGIDRPDRDDCLTGAVGSVVMPVPGAGRWRPVATDDHPAVVTPVRTPWVPFPGTMTWLSMSPSSADEPAIRADLDPAIVSRGQVGRSVGVAGHTARMVRVVYFVNKRELSPSLASMPQPIKRAAFYARVSTSDKGQTIEN